MGHCCIFHLIVKRNAEFHTTKLWTINNFVRIFQKLNRSRGILWNCVCLLFEESICCCLANLHFFSGSPASRFVSSVFANKLLLTAGMTERVWAGGKSTVCKQLCLSVFDKLRMPFPVQKGSAIAPRLVRSLRSLSAWVRRPFLCWVCLISRSVRPPPGEAAFLPLVQRLTGLLKWKL